MLPAPAVFTLKGTRYSGNLIPAAPAVLLIRAKRKNQHFIWFASQFGVISPSTSRSRAAVARRAHNPKVGGSIPPFATQTSARPSAEVFSFIGGGRWAGRGQNPWPCEVPQAPVQNSHSVNGKRSAGEE